MLWGWASTSPNFSPWKTFVTNMALSKCRTCGESEHGRTTCAQAMSERGVTNITNSVTNAAPVTNRRVTNIPKPAPVPPTEKQIRAADERMAKWREKNRDHYNAYQREYMRRRREEKG